MGTRFATRSGVCVANDSEIKAIAASLFNDAKTGKAGRYEWQLVAGQR